MNKIIPIAVIAVMASPNAFAAICQQRACTGNETNNLTFVSNCTTKTTKCYGNNKVMSCDTCNEGYTRTRQSINASDCSNSITYYSCIKGSSGGGTGGDDCDGTCTDCTSTSWVSAGLGYQSRTTATCNTSTCVCSHKKSYRCAAGYYGSPPAIQPLDGLIGCNRCPSSGGVYGTSAAGSTDITSCYLPSGSIGSDSIGSFTYTSNCYYSN